MKIYLDKTVLEAALDRIHRVFQEFPVVFVNISGGKDSTVLMNLVLRVAEERGRLPLNVLFIDQEAEWRHTIEYVRAALHDPRVKPFWFQGPLRISNATSGLQRWLYCWREGDDWIRPKEPDSIHENLTGTLTFKDLFAAIARSYYPDGPVASLSGVRCDESPGRLSGLTAYSTYKDITWGRRADHHKVFTFYPLYDWGWRDVWKAIHDHGWPYCRLYDFMFQHGIPIRKMRVSNVHHETAIHSLTYLQEVEPDTWDKIVERVSGVNSVSKAWDAYAAPDELPFMFSSWKEYRDYLVDHLVPEIELRARFRDQFRRWDELYEPAAQQDLVKMEIAAVLVNDYHGVKYTTFQASHARLMRAHGKMKRWTSL